MGMFFLSIVFFFLLTYICLVLSPPQTKDDAASRWFVHGGSGRWWWPIWVCFYHLLFYFLFTYLYISSLSTTTNQGQHSIMMEDLQPGGGTTCRRSRHSNLGPYEYKYCHVSNTYLLVLPSPTHYKQHRHLITSPEWKKVTAASKTSPNESFWLVWAMGAPFFILMYFFHC